MSLFPAYSENSNPDEPINSTEQNWLENSSFSSAELNDESEEVVALPPKRKKPKENTECENTYQSKYRLSTSRQQVHESFSLKNVAASSKNEEKETDLSLLPDIKIDRIGSYNNRLLPTLMKHDCPQYIKPKYRSDDESCRPKKSNKWRYYNRLKQLFKSDAWSINDTCITDTNSCKNELQNTEFLPVDVEDTIVDSLKLEEQHSKITGTFNSKLEETPDNEQLWLEYIHFQDKIYEFEKYYRGSKGGKRATNERKLCMLAKALEHNPYSSLLLECKYNIMNEMYSAEKVSEDLNAALRLNQGNIILWKQLINCTQYSLSRFKVSDVKSVIGNSMQKISFVKQGGILKSETDILELFTRYGLFLRQSGLWEQLNMLIRLNLQLNYIISNTEDFNLLQKFPSEKVAANALNDENAILASGLPLTALWPRVEKLRQQTYWYPCTVDDGSDPQRIATPSDVADAVRPLTSRQLTLHLAATSMALLKVPILPHRDTPFRSLNTGIWLDSAEVLLAAFSAEYSCGRFKNVEDMFSACLKDLVSFPEYLSKGLYQEEYLNFVASMFQKLSQGLNFRCETLVIMWWVRFERALLSSNLQPEKRKKQIKSQLKNLLKNEKHRNNVSLYVEFALLELASGEDSSSAVRILDTTLQMYSSKVLAADFSDVKPHLFRTYVELLLQKNELQKCTKLLVALALDTTPEHVTIDEHSVRKSSAIYSATSDDFVGREDMAEEFTLELEYPQFTLEMIRCEAWFRYLTESAGVAMAFLERLVYALAPYSRKMCKGTYYREILSETMISILNYHCNSKKSNYTILGHRLEKSIEEYPNNMFLLCIYAELEMKLSFVSPWWKIKKCLMCTDSSIAKLILVLLNRRKIACVTDEENIDSYPSFIGDRPLVGRMKNLLAELTKNNVTRKCPLFWLIYLQYAAQYETESKCKDIFYLAIESCPWVKALYMTAAHILPSVAHEIQELLLEKEMRVHITLDEIDILRSVD